MQRIFASLVAYPVLTAKLQLAKEFCDGMVGVCSDPPTTNLQVQGTMIYIYVLYCICCIDYQFLHFYLQEE